MNRIFCLNCAKGNPFGVIFKINVMNMIFFIQSQHSIANGQRIENHVYHFII